MKLSKNFDSSEFDCPCCGQVAMDTNFIRRLQYARDVAGVPFVINSGYRCPEYNVKLKNSVPDSAHTTGQAADIKVSDSQSRFILLSVFLETGFTRIGVGKTFIHVDTDPDKPQNVVWMY